MTPEWSARPGQPGRVPSAQRPARRSGRRKYPLSAAEHQICAAVARLRVEWALSQSQFVRLLNTAVRTVKRWESHSHKPTPEVRIILASFQDYIAAHGLEAFRERFVREEPRRGKPGPAERLIDLAFDAWVAGPVHRLDPPAATSEGGGRGPRVAESPAAQPAGNVRSAHSAETGASRAAPGPPTAPVVDGPPNPGVQSAVGGRVGASEPSPRGALPVGVQGGPAGSGGSSLVSPSGDKGVKNADFGRAGAPGPRVVNNRDRMPAMDRRLAGAPPLDPRTVVTPGLGVKFPCIRREP